MGWTSHADFVLETNANGKKQTLDFNRTVITGATSVAGRWHEAMSGAGTGGAMTLTGTPGTGIVMTRSTAGALPLNANVSTDTRHMIAGFSMSTSTTIAPASVLLTDIIHIYPSCVMVTTPSTISNHPTWTGTGDTRMTSAVGVQMSMLLTTAGTVAGQIQPTYTNQAGTAGRTTAGIAGSFCSVIAAHPAGCFASTSVTATGNIGGLFLPTVAGDTGIQKLDSYAITTGITSGVGCFILHRPIAYLPIGAANALTMADYYTLGLPRIYDDSCLAIFALVGGAYAAGGVVQGQVVYGWG